MVAPFLIFICNESVKVNDINNIATYIFPLSFNNPIDVFVNLIEKNNTLVSFIVSLTVVVSPLLTFSRKGIPREYVAKLSGLFACVLFGYQFLLILFDKTDFIGTIYLTILLLAYSIYHIKVYDKNHVQYNDEYILDDSNTEEKAINYIKAKIKKSHAEIECIQLYSYYENRTNDLMRYRIEYIGGAMKQRNIEVNALMGINLSLDNETFKEVDGIINFYNQYLNASDLQQMDTICTVLKGAISKGTERIKNILSKIKYEDNVTSEHCSLARVLIVYCSILASLSSRGTTFVGFEDDKALGLEKDIEQNSLRIKELVF